jgi:UDP-N-acetylmuramoylalanine--D-glutamate ligase
MSHFDTDYSMEEAVAFVAKHARPDGICLLSPAASSYDHYKNFEERGTHFKTCVNKLIS